MDTMDMHGSPPPSKNERNDLAGKFQPMNEDVYIYILICVCMYVCMLIYIYIYPVKMVNSHIYVNISC